jgi:hypothetical protein
VHNFIHIHDPDEIDEFDLNIRDQDPGHVYGELAERPALHAEKDRAEIRWDNIAQAMWDSYLEVVNNGIHDGDNLNTTQTLEYTKDKYNVKIRK